MTRLTRRTFLRLAGVTAAASGLYGLGLVRRNWDVSSQELPLSGPISDRHVLGVCQLCAAGCGLSARIVDGRVVKLDGNPYHPNNQGKLCPKGQAGLQVLYDPDRIRGPMRRVGDGEWVQISWDEALGEIVDALQGLRTAGHPERFVFLHDGGRDSTRELIARFCQAFGSPNDVRYPTYSADGTPLAHLLTQGWNDHAAYDWENTDYLLCFGGAFLEAWQPLVRQLRAYARLRRGRPNVRAKIVQIEPRGSITATKADEWLAVKPGTEGALALGMAHVIVRDEVYDAEFVEAHTEGFEAFSELLRDYDPEHVAEITGVPAETIERIAWEFAAARPAAVAAGDVGGYTNSLYSQWAIHTLNALVGSIDAPGGVLRQVEPPLAPWAEPLLDEVAAQGLAQPRADGAGSAAFPLAASVPHALTAAPYPIEVLFLYQANPLYQAPAALDWASTLANIPLVVSFSSYLDETSAQADLLLPDCTYLEKWFLEPLMPSVGYPAVGLGKPLVSPLYDTRNTADVLIGLAQALGGALAESFSWSDALAALQERVQGLYDSGVGMPAGTETFEEYWAELESRAVWTVEPYEFGQWERVLATPSARFEFSSQLLTGDELLPAYQPPSFDGDESEYPFFLCTFKPITYTERWGANLPWLQEIYGLHLQERWDSWVELNPETAHELGIEDGERVQVESPYGSVETRARLWVGTPPEVVSMPLGQGHSNGGRWAEGRGVNPQQLTSPSVAALSGEPAPLSVRVRVRKV